MKEERKFDNYVRDSEKVHTNRVLSDIKLVHPELDKKQSNRNKIKKRLAWIVPFATIAVCTAIIIPCVLLNDKNIGKNPDTDNRYGYQIGDYNTRVVNSTIKEYNEQTGSELLYLDWYDVCVDGKTGCVTREYFDVKTDERLGFLETMMHEEKEIAMELSVVFNDNSLQRLAADIESCKIEAKINNVDVFWVKRNDNFIGTFLWNKNRYFLNLTYAPDENALFEIVEEILTKK